GGTHALATVPPLLNGFLRFEERLEQLGDTLLLGPRDDEVGARLQRRMGVVDGDRVGGPVEQLAVVLAVPDRDRARLREADVLGEEGEPGALRDVAFADSREEGRGFAMK